MKRLRAVLLSIVAILILAVAAIIWWGTHLSGPEPTTYSAALADSSVTIGEHAGFITLRPRSSLPAIGLLFYPGLHVAPESYVAKLSAIASAANIQIVIGHPTLGIAVFSTNQADAMKDAIPDIKHWYIGGHSLGGSTACIYASKHASELEGVVLLATYCGLDISKTHLRVLDITGANDGVIPSAKIMEHRGELPSDATFVSVPGMNHAQVGNYGTQPGDNPASIADSDAKSAIVKAAMSFFQSAAR